jgi:DNA-binding NtrC family response regulator
MTQGARILVVDDSPATLEVVGRILTQSGHQVETAPDVAQAVRCLEGIAPDLVITDFRMPGADGLDLVRHVRENLHRTAVIMLTGFPSIEGAVEAVKGGAEAYLTKPFTQTELLETVSRVLEAFEGRRVDARSSHTSLPLVGRSDAARSLRAAVEVAALSHGPVLIEAPIGAGGLPLARALHDAGGRASCVFAVGRCDLLVDPSRELFGDGEAEGLVGGADHGTFVVVNPEYLNEVAQVHLLRLIQERRIIPVGGGRGVPVDVRVIAVSSRDLERQAGTGHFRRDLLERLSEQRIRVTPLTHRREDIVDLVHEIVAQESELLGCTPPSVSDKALEALVGATWSGDMEELASTLRTVVGVVAGRPIEIADLPLRFRFNAAEVPADILPLRDLEAAHIRAVLARVGDNKTEAARLLGIDRKTLRAKLQKS